MNAGTWSTRLTLFQFCLQQAKLANKLPEVLFSVCNPLPFQIMHRDSINYNSRDNYKFTNEFNDVATDLIQNYIYP